nr:hypothetical protein [Rhizobium sp. P32RR-XVIII]
MREIVNEIDHITERELAGIPQLRVGAVFGIVNVHGPLKERAAMPANSVISSSIRTGPHVTVEISGVSTGTYRWKCCIVRSSPTLKSSSRTFQKVGSSERLWRVVAVISLEKVLDPERIFIGGTAPGALLTELARRLQSLGPSVRAGFADRQVEVSSLGDRCALIGATALQIHSIMTPRVEQLARPKGGQG